MSRLGIDTLHLPTFFLRPWVRFVLAPFLFFFIIFLTNYFVDIEKYHYELANKEHTQRLASKIAQNIELHVNHTMNLSQALSLLSVDHASMQHYFQSISEQILKSAPFVRHVTLAKDNVITHIYPRQGNEKALGLRYMDIPAQRDDIIRAIETKKNTLSGPVELVQGGKGIITRTPLFLGKNNDDYWGLVSLVIDLDAFYKYSGLLPQHPELEMTLLGKDERVIFGDSSLLTNPEHIVLPINFAADTWYLGALLKKKIHDASYLYIFQIVGFVLAVFLASLVFFLLKSYETIHYQSLHDPLTNLPNLRLFYETLQHYIYHAKREKSSFSVLFIDINKFKHINDSLGHKVGDIVLKEVSKRLKMSLRESDTIARVGGDEFVILLKYANNDDEVLHVIKKIKEAIKAPLSLAKETLHLHVSVGHCFYPQDAQSVTDLIKMADNKMYVDKFKREEKK